MEYEPVIGLEVHAQLLTKSKLFCACSTDFGGEPNTNVCPVCLGLPGSLPVLNQQAVTFAVQAGLALGCTIHEKSIFARKNYFYPDLPKGYQISQFEEPIATHGHLDIEVDGVTRRVGITRAHMEEDAGKNVHGVAGDSLVDLNRAGTPLCEIVGEPDLRSSAEAAAYLRAMRDLLVFIGVNDGNLEEGSFRCDANVSIRPVGTEKFGTRCELKNINSFKFVQRAIDAEIIRQTAILDAGGKVRQETRSFDPDTGLTQTLRAKDDAHDYRYFPEPDLPPLRIEPAFIAAQRAGLRELPVAVRKRWVEELGLTLPTAQTLSQHPGYVSFFEAVCKVFDQPVKVANFVANEVLRGAKSHGLDATFTVTPAQVAELLGLVESGEISGKQAKEVFAALEEGTQKSARAIVEQRGLRVVSDSASLEKLCQGLIEKFPSQAASVRAGKKSLLGFFMGQAMKETGGSADPKLVSALFEKLLGGWRVTAPRSLKIYDPKPPWLKVRAPGGENYTRLKQTLRELDLYTVCEEARCPNVAECWASGTATVMLLGHTCTRGCRFCAVTTGNPRGAVDPREPEHVARAISQLKLRYVVLTMVDRDDLLDGGASHMARAVVALREHSPGLLVETLVGDFGGRMRDVNSMVDSGPDVFAHNIEVSRRMTPRIRDQRCDYDLSLGVLAHAKARHPERFVKSSIMVGVGETDDEVLETMQDLRRAGVDILTLGQYLRPTPKHAAVERYVTPERFDDYAREGREMGFAFVASGPLVRSSYHAAEGFVEARLRPPNTTQLLSVPPAGESEGQVAAAVFPLPERPELDRAQLIRPESLIRR